MKHSMKHYSCTVDNIVGSENKVYMLTTRWNFPLMHTVFKAAFWEK